MLKCKGKDSVTSLTLLLVGVDGVRIVLGTHNVWMRVQHFADPLTVVYSFKFGIRPIRNESNYITTIAM